MSRTARVARPALRLENLEAREVPHVTGTVFLDVDGDGVRETGDTGIPGVIVQFFNRGTPAGEATTTSDGSFEGPTLTDGEAYQVRIVTLQTPLSGQTLVPADQGTDDAVDSDATLSGANAVVNFTAVGTEADFDFGFTGGTATGLTLGGTVFADPDDTGSATGTTGIAGVKVDLLEGATGTTVAASTTTDTSGNYQFTGLAAGSYRVRLSADNFTTGATLAAFVPSTDSAATPDDDVDDDSNGEVDGDLTAGGTVVTGPITLALDDEPIDDGDTDANTNFSVDIGMVGEAATPTGGSISGRVFFDYNNNGLFDGPDTGLAGVTVSITGGTLTAPVGVVTDSSGNYTFPGLAAGTYTVTESQPTAPANVTGKDMAGTAGGDATVANVVSAIILDADEDATGYLFGEIPKVSTGGTVFNDADGDGQLDTGEAGVPDVTVTLTGTSIVTGAAIAPVLVTTNASGVYAFPNLDPGTYTITQTQPPGFTDGAEQNGTPAGTVGADTFTGIDLTSTAAASGGFNFGETSTTGGGTASLAGNVFADADSDGVKDPTEAGIPGVTITLTGTDDQSQAVNRTATTDTDGSFSFTGLRPGSYTIVETPPTTGFTDGAETAGTAGGTTTTNDQIAGIAITEGLAATGYLFAEIPATTGGTGSISGSIFGDADSDGVRDTGETGITGITVTLTGTDDQGTVSRTATTGTDGTYTFTGLRPGTYTVAATTPTTGFTDGTETAGTAGGSIATNDQISGIALEADEAATGYLFAEIPATTGGTGSLAGTIFNDADNNGVKDAAETGIQGVTVTLTGTDDQGAVNRTATTAADGTYSFTGLRPGTYAIAAATPTGFTDGTETAGTAGGATTTNDQITGINLAAGQAGTGYLFAERTAATGDDPADLRVRVTSSPATATPGGTVTLTFTARNRGDETATGVEVLARLGGLTFVSASSDDYDPDTRVWSVGDLDGDGVQTLTITATVPAAGTYYPNGRVSADDTAIPTRTGLTAVTAVGGTVSGSRFWYLSSGYTGRSAAPVVPPTPVTPTRTRLSGVVFADADGDGVRDTGETGVTGATVTLTGTDSQGTPVTRTLTTAASGTYLFTGLPAGTYSVAQTLPATGFTDGTATAGSAGGTAATDQITGIALTPGQPATGYLFAAVPTAAPGTASIAGTVYADADSDGVRDTAETGVGGVTITLTGTDDQGAVSRTTTTATNGTYSFTALRPGTYTVAEIPPATGFTDGAETAGTANGTTTTNDQISNITLTAGQTATGYLFAEIPTTTGGGTASIAGTVFRDADSDGVQDTGEAGVTGVTITLTGTDDQSQAVSRTTTTAADGTYSFTGLRAGSYALAETPPATGFTDGTETAGTAGGSIATNDQITGITLTAGLAATGYLFAEIPATTGNSTPTVASAPAAISLTGTGSRTIDLVGTFDDADIANTLIRFNTSAGAVNVELFDDQAPKTVANFLNYVTDGDYANSIFHRSAKLTGGVPFVLQGGGFAFDSDPTPSLPNIPTDPAVENEFSATRSNLKGTIAMAKLGGDPNSATNQFFFNLGDNSANLDNQNGGFTVFGRVVGAADQTVVDTLAAIPTQNKGGAFTDIPLNNYTGTAFPGDTTAANYALLEGVTIVSQPEVLTYSIVSNSDPAVATAALVKNRLTVTGVAAGTTTITIRATDKSGATVDTTVSVTVA